MYRIVVPNFMMPRNVRYCTVLLFPIVIGEMPADFQGMGQKTVEVIQKLENK